MSDGQNPRDDEAVARFIERFAVLLANAGMPRMPARVFCALMCDDDGHATAAELAQRLRVSPAAISGAVRYLVPLGLIRRVRLPGERRDRYRVDEDVWYELFVNRERWMDNWLATLADGVTAVGGHTGAGERLRQTHRYFEFLRDELKGVIERWRAVEADRTDPRRR